MSGMRMGRGMLLLMMMCRRMGEGIRVERWKGGRWRFGWWRLVEGIFGLGR